MYIHMTHTHIHTYTHTHIHTYIHTHIHTYTHTHIHTYTHTHIHTYTHTGVIEGSLDLLLELCPVPVSHGRVLEVLDEGHCLLERVNAATQAGTHSPVCLVLEEEEGEEEEEEEEGEEVEEEEEGEEEEETLI